MDLQLDIDFTTPSPLQSRHGDRLCAAGATRFGKTLGLRNTYSLTLTNTGDGRLEEVVGDAMLHIRTVLRDFDPRSINAVALHVTRIGALPL